MQRVYNAILKAPSRSWVTSTHVSRKLYHPQRHRYLSIVTSPKVDEVKVKVGSSGHVILDIHHPTKSDAATPIILYLPRGPSVPDLPNPPLISTLSALSHITNATTIQVNYRVSSTLPYPTPVHDVLACYDWVLKNVVHGAASWQNPPRSPRVGVCGELIGGSLAAMLALTECHARKPGGISAAALGNPVADWTFPAPETPRQEMDTLNPLDGRLPTVEPSLRKRAPAKSCSIDSWTAFADSKSLPAQTLLSARDAFFTKPEKWFDPFASPLLFFRTASTELPTLESPDTPADPAMGLAPIPVKRRKARRRFPPLHSDLSIPTMRVDVGEKSVLRDQGVEFVERVKRSFPSNMKQPTSWQAEWIATEETEGDKEVELVRREGVGLWGEEELVGVGGWLTETLRRHRG